MATEVKTRANPKDQRFTAEQCPCVIVSNDADPAQYAVVALADFPDDDAERRDLWPWAFSPAPVPERVSNAQARFALVQAGFSLPEIDALVAADPTGLYATFWERSPEFLRESAALQTLFAVLPANEGKSAQQLSDDLDALFRAAEGIRP